MLQNLIRDDFLDPDRVRQWVEGILSKVVSDLPKCQNKYELVVQNEYGTFIRFTIRKSGPAFTIMLNVPSDNEAIHVDFAPALAFSIYSIHGSSANLNAVLKVRTLRRCAFGYIFTLRMITKSLFFSIGIKYGMQSRYH